MVVILLPYSYQIGANEDAILKPQSIMHSVLEQNKIKSYNFAREFNINNYEVSDLYLYGDGIHFSKLGHLLIRAKMKIILDEFLLTK